MPNSNVTQNAQAGEYYNSTERFFCGIRMCLKKELSFAIDNGKKSDVDIC